MGRLMGRSVPCLRRLTIAFVRYPAQPVGDVPQHIRPAVRSDNAGPGWGDRHDGVRGFDPGGGQALAEEGVGLGDGRLDSRSGVGHARTIADGKNRRPEPPAGLPS